VRGFVPTIQTVRVRQRGLVGREPCQRDRGMGGGRNNYHWKKRQSRNEPRSRGPDPLKDSQKLVEFFRLRKKMKKKKKGNTTLSKTVLF